MGGGSVRAAGGGRGAGTARGKDVGSDGGTWADCQHRCSQGGMRRLTSFLRPLRHDQRRPLHDTGKFIAIE